LRCRTSLQEILKSYNKLKSFLREKQTTMDLTLPADALAAVGTQASAVMTAYWPIVAVALGLPLGFYIVHKVIGLITRHAR
jgi:hypothetical protein